MSEREIGAEFESSPRLYGESCIDNSEEQVLNLPPKFATYDRVDQVDVAAQVEKALAKVRWDLAKPVEIDEKGEPKPEVREHFYDIA